MSGSTSANQETFLSRVFGLHSVYNQLEENYQYYDSEDALGDFGRSTHNSTTDDPKVTEEGPNTGQKVARNSDSFSSERPANLLDSELDLDLSLDEEQAPMAETVSWATRKPKYGSEELEKLDEFLKGLLSSLAGPKLKFDLGVRERPKSGPKGPQKLAMETADELTAGPSTARMTASGKGPLEGQDPAGGASNSPPRRLSGRMVPPKERALYLWANVTNMDAFLSDVYYYYTGKGMYNIVLSRAVELAILVFSLFFAVFLVWGVDYDAFATVASGKHATLSDLIRPGFVWRVPAPGKLLLVGFGGYVVLRTAQLAVDCRYRLRELGNFYRQLVGALDDELATISWAAIVEKLMQLPPKPQVLRLNAHDIANRIMRKENYMVALVNREVLALGLPKVLGIDVFSAEASLTRTLDWNLRLCIYNFIFTPQGQLQPRVLRPGERNHLAKELAGRFRMAALVNVLLCPFLAVYYVLVYFFRYFSEYRSNPASIVGLRQYTPWAEWRLREYNELPHLFVRRLRLSQGPANTYVAQFPGGVVIRNAMHLVHFVLGAITAVLVLMGLWLDDESRRFWLFELTEGRSAVFYISVLGTVWAVTTPGPEESSSSPAGGAPGGSSGSFIYDPEAALRYVSQFTHYLPRAWHGRLHTAGVKNEFCGLYSLKIVLILREIVSVVVTPFILWFCVLRSSGAVIDFFRDHSVHVDGLGHVCYFAVFNFEEKDKNMGVKRRKKRSKPPVQQDIELSRLGLDDSGSDDFDRPDDKMIKSYMYFLESYGGQGRRPERPNDRLQRRQEGPSASLFAKDDAMTESAYDVQYKFEDDDDENGKKAGVLGLLNQFYKQEVLR